MSKADDHEYLIRRGVGGYRVLRDAGTDRERGLSSGAWVEPDDALQRWPSEVGASIAQTAQLTKEQRDGRTLPGR